MAPVIFTGVSMRAILLAAAAAIWAGNAGAAQFELKYTLDYARYGFEDHSNPDDNNSAEMPNAEFDISIIFDAATVAGLTGVSLDALAPTIVSAIFDTDVTDPGGIISFLLRDFSLSTDANGKITSIATRLHGLGDCPCAFGIMEGSEGWISPYGFDEIYSFKGRWHLTNLDMPPVPLPAGAPLLLAGLAGLALVRRAGSRSTTL